MNIVLATTNKKKVEEIKKIFGVMDTAPGIYTLNDFPAIEDVEEDGTTFAENALKKARHVHAATRMTAIADDSGLEVDALEGAPGVFSARYAGEGASDEENSAKLLEELKDVPDEKRSARFVCCIALVSSGEEKTFMGYIRGTIGRELKGDNGFGYDPLFYPEGSDRTFAEMSDTEKNAISHRAMALRELRKYLLEKGDISEGSE